MSVELILGGVRSGKSTEAEKRAFDSRKRVVYVATASGDDAEMVERIRLHKQRRPKEWKVVEESVKLVDVLTHEAASDACIVVECLTLWLSNLLSLDDEQFFKSCTDGLVAVLPELPGRIIVVSNETGLGVVPVNALARRFCDEAGRLHQRIASISSRVTFMMAGLTYDLKPSHKQDLP